MLIHRNRAAALFAMLAMVLQGFLPLLAQANAKAPDASLFGDICSVDGPVSIADQSGGTLPGDGGAGKHQKHCALCVTGERLQALVPAPVLFPSSADLAAESPTPHGASHFRSTSVSPAQPRAPPVQI